MTLLARVDPRIGIALHSRPTQRIHPPVLPGNQPHRLAVVPVAARRTLSLSHRKTYDPSIQPAMSAELVLRVREWPIRFVVQSLSRPSQIRPPIQNLQY